MELPADATPRDRMMWALLAAIVGIIEDGEENQRPFERLETACRYFGVPAWDFDTIARHLDFYYYKPWDAYLDKETYMDVSLRESVPYGGTH